MAVGAGLTVQHMETGGAGSVFGKVVLGLGFVVLLYMLAGWFTNVVNESLSGYYSAQINRSFRQGMSWFIFSEVMFFGAFFWCTVLCTYGFGSLVGRSVQQCNDW